MLHQEDDAEHEHATPHVDYQYGFDMVFCRRAIRILRISLPALWSWDGFWLAVFVFMVRPSRPHGNRLLDYVFEPFPTALRAPAGASARSVRTFQQQALLTAGVPAAVHATPLQLDARYVAASSSPSPLAIRSGLTTASR